MVKIKLDHIYKKYAGNDDYSVTDFDMEMKDNEFVVFVGPSGCGKSTTLRMVAGLETISKGNLFMNGQQVNEVQPKDRDIAMVFQNYALYPQMTVADNMGFGLKIRKVPHTEIKKRVDDAAEILGLSDYLTRKPGALSGGQRQRVALGRAIVRDASLFLLDEPLSNLDAKLRVEMRTQIAQLHQRLETNMIYVTHDQVEAMTMADRIVIMNDGKVQQIGTPDELYNKPTNKFVAGFMGSPAMNFFDVHLHDNRVSNGKGLDIVVPEGRLKGLRQQGYLDKDVVMGVRPEDIHTEQIAIDTFTDSIVNSQVVVSEFLGTESNLYSKVGTTEFVAQVNARDFHRPGENVEMAFEMNKAHFFDKDNGVTIE
ncbi:ABC transporter ATP-binding protein [Lactiplantibacillus dongliensis]|uniref:ABC transporter ATP-binding protein n=1 Tax=Lactiplantibacillus dongliensis TaxID=2559919 RepID=A0ABW1R993_9LACO|nr:sn-glycerol-3-phosphate ABC transporter ATP-binding protein UgpC [Lactiplantibacillus dongliensis]